MARSGSRVRGGVRSLASVLQPRGLQPIAAALLRRAMRSDRLRHRLPGGTGARPRALPRLPSRERVQGGGFRVGGRQGGDGATVRAVSRRLHGRVRSRAGGARGSSRACPTVRDGEPPASGVPQLAEVQARAARARRGSDPGTHRGMAMTPAPFIVGVGRSGTTLLRLMLDAHPDLAIPPETRFIPLAAQSCATATDPAKSLVETLTSRVHWPDFHVDGAVLA